jgi:hypothetical protein
MKHIVMDFVGYWNILSQYNSSMNIQVNVFENQSEEGRNKVVHGEWVLFTSRLIFTFCQSTSHSHDSWDR